MRIFVYGTLKKGFWNHNRFIGGSKFLGTGETAYRYLMIGQGVPMIMPSRAGKRVTGEVYEVNPQRLPELDQLESAYERVRGEILMDDGDTLWASYYIGRKKRYWIDMDSTTRWDRGDVYTWEVIK
jgi:gamma-glutamylaminecyclotransferase